MIAYNLFLYLSIWDISYLYYVLYVTAVFFTVFAYNGLGHQFLWRDHVWWQSKSVTLLYAIAYFLGMQFSELYE